MPRIRINKKTTILASLVAAPAAFELFLRSLDREVQERFPNLDPVLVKKSFRAMLKSAVTGKLNKRDTSSDAAMDVIFLEHYDKIASR